MTSTWWLTTDVEALTGTSGNDTFIATNTTLNTGDSIDGGAGTDTLTVTMGAAATPIATLKNVENVEFVAGVATNGSINAGNWTGVENITVKGIGVALADGVSDGATGWAIENLQNNVKLGLSNITTATDSNAALYAGFAAGKLGSSTATLSLDLDGVVGNTPNTGVANIQVGTAGADKFTKLAVESTGTNRLNVEGTAAGSINLTEITITGAGSTTLGVDGTNAILTNLATVNAGDANGALTMNVSASTKAVTFTGSEGKNTIIFGNGDNVITGGAADDTFTLGTGNNTVTGGAGNDTVIGAVADFTKNDKIDLGEGDRDALIYNNVTALNSSGVNATQLAALNGYSGIDVVGSSAAVTAIDAGYFTQNIFALTKASAHTANINMTNVSGDTLALASGGITGADSGAALSVAGALPNQSFTLELAGAGATVISGHNGSATNTALKIDSGISTVNLISTTTAASTAGLTNEIKAAGTTVNYVVDNASAGTFTLKGNVDLNIGDGGAGMGATKAGFSKAVDFNASEFTGKLNITASNEADVITGGSGNDTIRAGGGNDVIDLTAGGKDTLVFESSGSSNGKDIITGFNAGSGGDVLNFSEFDATGVNTLVTPTSLTGAATLANHSTVVVDMNTAISGKAYDGADFGDLFGAGKVFSTTATSDDKAIILIQGTDQTQVFMATDGNTKGTWEASDVVLVGVLSDVTNATAFDAANISFA